MYISMIHDLYVALCALHSKSNHLPSDMYLAPFNLYSPPTLLPSGNRCAAVCVPELQFSIPHVSETMWFLTFSV